MTNLSSRSVVRPRTSNADEANAMSGLPGASIDYDRLMQANLARVFNERDASKRTRSRAQPRASGDDGRVGSAFRTPNAPRPSSSALARLPALVSNRQSVERTLQRSPAPQANAVS